MSESLAELIERVENFEIDPTASAHFGGFW